LFSTLHKTVGETPAPRTPSRLKACAILKSELPLRLRTGV
jgi:hypothetical protein